MTRAQKSMSSLMHIESALKKNNFDFFLDSGTLLGLVREKQIIEWDNDIDIGFIENSKENLILLYEDLAKLGYNVNAYRWNIFAKKSGELEVNIRRYKRDGGKLFTIYKSCATHNRLLRHLAFISFAEGVYYGRSRAKRLLYKTRHFIPKILVRRLAHPTNYLSMVDSELVEPLGSLDINGVLHQVPILSEKYLCLKYGESWMTPQETYEYKVNDGTITEYQLDIDDVAYILQKIHDAFDRANAKIYLSAGTLLGAVREDRVLPWDTDVDVASSEDCLCESESIAADLAKSGAAVYVSKLSNVVSVYYKGIGVDIDFFRRDEEFLTMPMKLAQNNAGTLLMYAEWLLCFEPKSSFLSNLKNGVKYPTLRYYICKLTSAIPRKVRAAILGWVTEKAPTIGNARGLVMIPSVLADELAEVMFLGRIWKVPKRYDDYLTLFYGDWRTPQRENIFYDLNGPNFSKTQVPGRRWVYK